MNNTHYENYTYGDETPVVLSGLRAIDDLGAAANKWNAQRVLVICGSKTLTSSNVVQRVESALGDRSIGHLDVARMHASIDVVEAAGAKARALRPDTLVSVGGGSAVGMTKAIALLVSTDAPLSEFQPRFTPQLPEITVKVVSVATTMGFAEKAFGGGSFASTTGDERISIAGDGRTSPTLLIIDGDALATTPTSILKGTTIGQLRVAIESVMSSKFNALSEALGLHAIRLLDREFRSGWNGEPEQLLRIKGASYLAAKATASIGTSGLNSAIVHLVGTLTKVSHGDANAILLPHTIRFNAQYCGDQLHRVAEAFGLEPQGLDAESAAAAVVDRLHAIYEDLGIPRRLRDIGVPKDSLPAIARGTMHDHNLVTNPRPVRDADEVEKILAKAW